MRLFFYRCLPWHTNFHQLPLNLAQRNTATAKGRQLELARTESSKKLAIIIAKSNWVKNQNLENGATWCVGNLSTGKHLWLKYQIVFRLLFRIFVHSNNIRTSVWVLGFPNSINLILIFQFRKSRFEAPDGIHSYKPFLAFELYSYRDQKPSCRTLETT